MVLAEAIGDEVLAVLQMSVRAANEILIFFLELNFDSVTCYADFKCFAYC